MLCNVMLLLLLRRKRQTVLKLTGATLVTVRLLQEVVTTRTATPESRHLATRIFHDIQVASKYLCARRSRSHMQVVFTSNSEAVTSQKRQVHTLSRKHISRSRLPIASSVQAFCCNRNLFACSRDRVLLMNSNYGCPSQKIDFRKPSFF